MKKWKAPVLSAIAIGLVMAGTTMQAFADGHGEHDNVHHHSDDRQSSSIYSNTSFSSSSNTTISSTLNATSNGTSNASTNTTANTSLPFGLPSRDGQEKEDHPLKGIGNLLRKESESLRNDQNHMIEGLQLGHDKAARMAEMQLARQAQGQLINARKQLMVTIQTSNGNKQSITTAFTVYESTVQQIIAQLESALAAAVNTSSNTTGTSTSVGTNTTNATSTNGTDSNATLTSTNTASLNTTNTTMNTVTG